MRYTCCRCGEKFYNEWELIIHERTCGQTRPIQMEPCRACHGTGDKYIRTDRGGYPIPCPCCGGSGWRTIY